MTEVETLAAPVITQTGANPDLHSTTLGRWVIGGCREMVPGDLHASGREGIVHRMNSSRLRLMRLNAEQSELFDRICAQSVPLSLQEVKEAEAGTSTWQAWLGEKASDGQLLEYLLWHVDSIEGQQQDPGIQEEIVTQRAQYKENVRRGLTEGWLHGAAEAAVDKVDDVDVYIGDVFCTALEETLAYCTRGSNEVVIGGATAIPTPGNYDSTRCVVKQVAQHEFNHVVLGRLGVRWLDEAMTEHIAQVLRHGKLEELDPDKRLNYSPPVYVGERRLLRYLLNEGREVIPVSVATLAYSEEPSGLYEARSGFKDAFQRAWGHMVPEGAKIRAIDQVGIYVGSLERKYQLEGLSSTKAIKQAMADVNHVMEHRPEAMFMVNPNPPNVVLAP